MTEPASKPLRCHRCGSADLSLNEVFHEHARYEEGLFIDGEGAIRAHGGPILSQGEPQRHLTAIDCANCGHSWHPRRVFAGIALDEQTGR